MSWLDNVKVKPTQAQVDLAEDIADTLDIDLPDEFTKLAYTEFISENKDDYDAHIEETTRFFKK